MTGHSRRHNQQHRAYQNRSHQHQRSSSQPSNSHNHNQSHSYQQIQHQSFSCSLEICYSYLLAIFSSFLVVLGLYLAITRFNARFLYLSVAGLLIEALSACLYCISSIRKSKLAQYKQASDEFNIENNRIPPSVALHISAERQVFSRQQQAQAVTHILTNSTLNQNAISSETSNTTNLDHSNNPANPINRPTTCGEDQALNTLSTPIQDDSQPDNSADNQSIGTSSSTGALLQQDALMQQHKAENANGIDKQLPTSDHITCQEPPSQESPTTTSTSQSHERNDEESSRLHDIILNDKDVSVHNKSEINAQDNQFRTQVTTNSNSQVSAIDETDLINRQTIVPLNVRPNEEQIIDGSTHGPKPGNRGSLLPTTSQAELSPSASSRIRNQRNSNLRRTLVMGLSGEEEMIEIDEEDLDNMSILPPPYESIANVDVDNDEHRQSQ